MSSKLNPNCYGFATRCRKLYFCFVGCRKPKKVGNHWHKSIQVFDNVSTGEKENYCKSLLDFLGRSYIEANEAHASVNFLKCCLKTFL